MLEAIFVYGMLALLVVSVIGLCLLALCADFDPDNNLPPPGDHDCFP